MRTHVALLFTGWIVLATHTPLDAAERERQPNVLFILADDLGWSDTTLFGTTTLYETPNIAKLAARGMTFSRAYACSPLCSPTRASILTGLSPARIGITAPNCHTPQVVLKATPSDNGPPNLHAAAVNSVTRFDTKYFTLAEALKEQGYATGHFGKWHLGKDPYSPLQHGFDVDVPHWHGPGPAGSYVAPWKFPDFDPDRPDQHLEDRMADEAVAFMETHRDAPFFLNYWMFRVHARFDATRTLIEKYAGKVQQNEPQRCPTYAAMIESMDDAVGRLLDRLDELELADNTIIIFASDNGGNMYSEVDGEVPTSNTPLRGGKATMYEGGVRGPGIVVQPGHIKAGSRSDEVIQSSDFYPTLLELLNVKPQEGQQFDGISIVPALEGKPLERDAIFTYFPHNPKIPDWLPPAVSVHHGDWKLIRLFHAGENGAHRWKLFNLKKDLGETNDLATDQPERVRNLDAMIERFLKQTNAVVPVPNKNFDPAKFHIEEEGISRRKVPKAQPHNNGSAKTMPPVAGWQAINNCRLSVDDGRLVVTCTGADPHLSYRLSKPLPAQSYTLDLTMASTAKGQGQVFWQEQETRPPFARERSQTFEVEHDGQSYNYRVELTVKKPIVAIRLDPATGAGVINISELKLTDDQGQVVRTWSFAADQNK